MAIRVEFFGMARQRAGVAELQLDAPVGGLQLGDALCELAVRLPQLGREMISDSRLHPSFTANIDGRRFVSDPATVICDGQCLLILSADAGG
jgi:sulfur-carrier protein